MLPAIASAQQVSAKGGKFDRTAGNDVIVVTGRSLSTPDLMPPLPVQVLSGDDLAHRRQGGLGETLAGLPGVPLDTFGGGASRPVIRGQTVPRLAVMRDGANLFVANGRQTCRGRVYQYV